MSLPENYFENQLVKIKNNRRTRILTALYSNDVQDEEDLIMIVENDNHQERVAYFINDFKMEKNDAKCLANAIKHSEPQEHISQLQMTTPPPPPPPQQKYQNVTLKFPKKFMRVLSEIHSGIKASQQKEVLSPVSASNTDHGGLILNTLQYHGHVHNVKPGKGESVFSKNTVKQAKKLKKKKCHERELVNLYTPYLQSIVEEINSLIRLINSEEYAWLRASSGYSKCDMKPDLFVAYHALVEYKDAYRNAPVCEVNRLFGRFPCWNCRSSIWCIFDAKWKIDTAAFGEKCKYLQSCCYQCRIWQGLGQQLKLILFDIEEFWMIEGYENDIRKLTKCKWTQSGSREVLKDFLTTYDPWMESTENLLKMLSVQLHPPMSLPDTNTPPPVLNEPSIFNAAILGAGAYGRAFLLTNGNVLKVAVGSNAAMLQMEYLTILNLQKNPNTQNFVIPVVPNTFQYVRGDQCDYAGYLLEYQGERVSSTCPRLHHNEITNLSPGNLEIELVKFLYNLHLTGHVHGDPRLDNVLLKDGELKWIDFMNSTQFNIIAKVNDFSILFSSLTGVDITIINPNIRNILDPPLTNRMSQLSTNNQPPSMLDQLIDYLGKLWSLDVREEDDEDVKDDDDDDDDEVEEDDEEIDENEVDDENEI